MAQRESLCAESVGGQIADGSSLRRSTFFFDLLGDLRPEIPRLCGSVRCEPNQPHNRANDAVEHGSKQTPSHVLKLLRS